MKTGHRSVTRFAPSPTGLLHIGNARSAILSYLLAKKNDLGFLLRIDDTDLKRSTQEYIDSIKADLQYLGVNWDYTFRQSEMRSRYEQVMQACIEAGLVYAVHDTEDDLEKLRRNLKLAKQAPAYKRHHAKPGPGPTYWRFDLGARNIVFHDNIVGKVEINLGTNSDPVISKPDGEFTYTFASIVDDLLEGVSNVIRGADHLTNTAIQLSMAEQMVAGNVFQTKVDPQISFSHYPLFTESGDKLSKRLGSLSIRHMTNFHPLAIAHYLVSAGSSKTIPPISSIDELIESFDLKNYSSSSLIEYSTNQIYQSQQQIFSHVDYKLVQDFCPVDLEQYWNILRETIVTKNQMKKWYSIIHDKISYSTAITPVSILNKGTALKTVKESKGGMLFLRQILTGQNSGPKLSDVVNCINDDIFEYRMNHYQYIPIKLYNSVSHKKELFSPINLNKVKIYCCGPTVYNTPHIGNMRSFVLFDVLYRFISFFYNTIYVRNVTDIDDKIIERALVNDISISKLTQQVYKTFVEDSNKLNLSKPTLEPFVTKYIPQIIDAIQEMLDQGFAYIREDGVYFEIKKLEQSHVYDIFKCIDNSAEKSDFVLWKFRETEGWKSPWGHGRPGWHIECTVMARNELGLPFDIHCGGRDLLFPHHTNESAQGYALNHCATANYWFHTNFINMDNMKMSKSLGNYLTLSDIDAHPMVVRLALLMTHYNHELPWSGLHEAKTIYNRWRRELSRKRTNHTGYPLPKFLEVLGDDLNTPLGIRVIDQALNVASNEEIIACCELIGITFDFNYLDNKEIPVMIEARQAARLAKDFDEADRMRQILLQLGVELEESSQGCNFWYQEV